MSRNFGMQRHDPPLLIDGVAIILSEALVGLAIGFAIVWWLV